MRNTSKVIDAVKFENTSWISIEATRLNKRELADIESCGNGQGFGDLTHVSIDGMGDFARSEEAFCKLYA